MPEPIVQAAVVCVRREERHIMAEAVAKANYKWRVVDIVVAAILAVASGVIFWGWDIEIGRASCRERVSSPV